MNKRQPLKREIRGWKGTIRRNSSDHFTDELLVDRWKEMIVKQFPQGVFVQRGNRRCFPRKDASESTENSIQSDPDLGELTVSLCYLPNAKRVTVTIVKASALKSMDITGKSDPYVKVILLIHGKKNRKKKTSVQPNTLNPSYNESLEFDLSMELLEDADLIFKVIDYDRVGANELIGCVGIGAHFEGLNRDHWFQMLEHHRVPITHSYNLRETIPMITCASPISTPKTLNLTPL